MRSLLTSTFVVSFTIATLFPPASFAIEDEKPISFCQMALSKTKNVAMAPVKWAKNNWLEFRAEVQEQGRIRYLLAPRRPPEKFHLLASFVDPIFDFPVEAYSFVKHRMFGQEPVQRRLSAMTSMPLGILSWTMIFQGASWYATNESLEAMESAVANRRFGSEYVSEWVLSGAITPIEGVKILKATESALLNRLAPIRDRAAEFQKLQLWSPEQVVKLNSILDSIVQNNKPDVVIRSHGFDKMLFENPEFKRLSQSIEPKYRFSLTLLTNPAVEKYGYSDSHWLATFFDVSRRENLTEEQRRGLHSLDEIYMRHSDNMTVTSLAVLTAQTIGQEKIMSKKINRASKLGFAPKYDFSYRADLPIFTAHFVFSDLKEDVEIDDELGLWKLLLNDGRFHGLRAGKEQQSDFVLLMKTYLHAKSLSQLHLLHRKYGRNLPLAEMCTLMSGANDVSPNPLFAHLKGLIPASTDRPGLDWLKFEIAELYYQTFTSDSASLDQSTRAQIFDAALAKERALIRSAVSDSGAALAAKFSSGPKPSCL